jgi:hypothetical protein
MPFIATPGAADANSYLTVEEADEYFEYHLYATTWTAASETTKESALVMASRLIDAMFVWVGLATTSTQSLTWPRTGMLSRNMYPIEDTVIPAELKAATAEYAVSLMTTNSVAPNEAFAQGVKEIKAGSVGIVFKDEAPPVQPIPYSALSLIPLHWYLRLVYEPEKLWAEIEIL